MSGFGGVVGSSVRRWMVSVLIAGSVMLAACGSSGSSSPGTAAKGGGVVQVVAAENFWGSIASQIGGSHAHVVSIITNPDTDPHDYEPTAADARTLASAQLVIENGIGYDPWVGEVPRGRLRGIRRCWTSASWSAWPMVGTRTGGTTRPTCKRSIAQIVHDFQQLDPADSAYFTAQQTQFNTVALGGVPRDDRRDQGRSIRAPRSERRSRSSRCSRRRSGST